MTSPSCSPFVDLGPDIFRIILSHLADEPVCSPLSTDGYRRLLPFAVCCTSHYELVTESVRGLAVLPVNFTTRATHHGRSKSPVPPFPVVLYGMKRITASCQSRTVTSSQNSLLGAYSNPTRRSLDIDLSDAVSNLPNLRALHLFRTSNVSDNGLATILERLPKLRELRVPSNHQITAHSMKRLAGCPQLQTVDLAYCTGLGDECGQIFRRLPSLKSLSVICWRISDAFVEQVAQCPTLEELDISACYQLKHYTIACLATHAKRLKVLQFRCASHLRDLAMTYLGKCSSLREIDLSMAKNITDEGIAHLADPEKMPCLRKLIISQCSSLTDDAVMTLSANQNIQSLDLSLCDLITDRAAEWFLHMPGLKELDLTGCPNISDWTVSILAESSRLRHLRLARCPRITDNGLETLCSSPSVPFELVDVKRCEGVTRKGIDSLEDVCNNVLTSLKVPES